jgi:very-short-patch-repair endonuclease
MLTVSGGRDARVATIAAQQRGRVARRQLLAAGLRPGQISRLIATDRLFALHVGVYAVGHPGPVELGAETAALLTMRPGALLCQITAARLWGLEVPRDEEIIHVLVDPRWARPRTGIRIHRSRLIAGADRRLRERLPVCSPARALLDLVLALGDRPLDRAYDQGLIDGVVHHHDIEELLGRTGGHPGHPRLHELAVAHLATGATRSEAEARLLDLIRATDLPRPRVNQRLHGYEVDLHWAAARLVVEIDGYRFHSTRAAFERDRVRDARLQAAGIEVLRVTWRQLEHEPYAVIARIAAALARRTVRG